MTTMQVQDIKRKKSVSSRYAPNSYRIFDEGVSNQSLPHSQIYSNQEAQLYTQPLIVPAQSIEQRNNPHAGRNAGFLRENVHSLNEPINQIQSRNGMGQTSESNKWWEWNTPKDEMDSAIKNKPRLSGARNASNPNDLNNYSTTYSKDMGYLNNVLEPGTQVGGINENNGAAQRYTYNTNGAPAVGVVPVNDLNTYTKAGEPQRVFTDKMSFEHGYNAREDNNYNQRGRREGAFVMEQNEPRQPVAFLPRPSSNNQANGSSVWGAMHPNDNKTDDNFSDSRRSSGLRKIAQVVDKNDPNKRRDPIGYFNDEKLGGSWGSSRNGNRQEYQQDVNGGDMNMNMNQYQVPSMGHQEQQEAREYNPSWKQANNNQRLENEQPNEYVDNEAMNNYQNPYPQGY